MRQKNRIAVAVGVVALGTAAASGLAARLFFSEGLVLTSAAVGVVGLLSAAVVMLVLHRMLYLRAGRLRRLLERVAGGNYLLRCETGDDEVGALGRAMNPVLEKLTDLSINVMDGNRELQLTQKELKLQEQLSEKTRLLEASNAQLESRVRDLNVLFSTSRALSTSIELPAMMSSFFQTAARSLDVDRIAVLLYDARREILTVTRTHGFGEAETAIAGMTIRPGEGVSGTVFQKKTLLYIRDLEADDRFLHFRGKVRLKGSMLALPLLTGDRCGGVMLLNRARTDAFSVDEAALFHVVASQVAAAAANALLFQKTQELATHDVLTALPNRRSLEARLELEFERASRFGTNMACLMIDVDHFKKFNDEHGHSVGDEVLKRTAALIGGQLRKVDMVARYGGEEFVAVLPRTDRHEAAGVAEKLRAAVAAAPFRDIAGEHGLSLTISVGVADTQDAPQTPRQLLDMADFALLDAKNAGRNRVVAYGKPAA